MREIWMRLLSWNLQGAVPPNGHTDRIEAQLEYLDSLDPRPDTVLLNEVNRYQADLLRDGLTELGYTDIADTLDWATELGESDVPPHHEISHVNGNLTGVHRSAPLEDLERISPSIREGPWDGADVRDWDTNFPEKILHTRATFHGDPIELWNVRAVPRNPWGEEKHKILENVSARIRKGPDHPTVLAGDFNAPKDELADGTLIPWGHDDEGPIAERFAQAERDILRGLEDQGMVDVFRRVNGYGDLDIRDTSHKTRRFDHIIASSSLNPTDCYYEPSELDCCDHSPIFGEFEIGH